MHSFSRQRWEEEGAPCLVLMLLSDVFRAGAARLVFAFISRVVAAGELWVSVIWVIKGLAGKALPVDLIT